MADKYISQSSGALTEIEATTTSAGAGNAGDIIALDSGGLIDPSMIPGESVLEVEASENLAAGDLVNLHDSTGIKVRKADATTTGKEAIGFVNAAVTSGNTATVYTTGSNTGVSGLTVGAIYYLDTTAGGVTSTAPSGSGNVAQQVGAAVGATELTFFRGTPITIA